jgi:hypothetical protein
MYNDWSPNSSSGAQQAWGQNQMYNPGGYGYGPGIGFMDNDGRGQELPYGYGQDHGISPDQQYQQHHYQQQQYQQQYQGQDKSGFAHAITEQQPHQQFPVHSPVLDPDQKGPHQW